MLEPHHAERAVLWCPEGCVQPADALVIDEPFKAVGVKPYELKERTNWAEPIPPACRRPAELRVPARAPHHSYGSSSS